MVEGRHLLRLNIAGYAAMVTVNILANTLPIGGNSTEYISDLYPNLFTPAGFTFSIWGLIYLLLGLYVGYQVLDLLRGGDGRVLALDTTGYLFFVSSLLNAAWIFAWHYLQIGLSLVIMLALLVTLLALHRRLNPSGVVDLSANWLAKLPFSIYLGWISVATIANVTVLLVHLGWNGFGMSDAFWTVLVLAAATALGAVYVLRRRDIAYAAVVLWAFYGIISQRLSSEPVETAIITAAGIGSALILISIAAVIIRARPTANPR